MEKTLLRRHPDRIEVLVRAVPPSWFVPAMLASVLLFWPAVVGLILWVNRWRSGRIILTERTLESSVGGDELEVSLVDLVGCEVSAHRGQVTIDLENRERFAMIGPLTANPAEEEALREFFREVDRRIEVFEARRGSRHDVPVALSELR